MLHKTQHILAATTVLATAALTQHRFVTFAGARAGANAACAGIANEDYAEGDAAGVNTHGRLMVEAGAAIAAGQHVKSDADGRAVPGDAATSEGRAYEAATAAGQFITVQR